jgi:hypothetical protein
MQRFWNAPAAGPVATAAALYKFFNSGRFLRLKRAVKGQ